MKVEDESSPDGDDDGWIKNFIEFVCDCTKDQIYVGKRVMHANLLPNWCRIHNVTLWINMFLVHDDDQQSDRYR